MRFPQVIYDMDVYREQLCHVSSFDLHLFHWHIVLMRGELLSLVGCYAPVTRAVPESSSGV